MESSRSSVDASVENVYFPYVNTQQLAYVVEVFPELNDQLDTPSADFLDTFRLRTGEAVYATKSQDAGIEMLDIGEVEIVTYWSKDMNAVTTRFCLGKNDKDECDSHPLCRFRNDECTENQLKVIVKYVFTQLDKMFSYLNNNFEIEEENFNWDRIVECWLWNGTIKTNIEAEDYPKLEGIMTEVADEEDYELPDAYSNLLRSAYEIVQNMPSFDDEDKPSDEYLLAKVLNIEQDELFDLPEDGGTGIWDVDKGDVVIVKKDGNKYRAISNLDNSQFQAMKLFNTGIVQAKIKEDTSVSKKRKASAQGGRSTNV